MADDKKSAGKKSKKKSIKIGDNVQLKIKTKGKDKNGNKGKSKKDSGALENLAKLAESPLVADLIAVGATAAVAALAGAKKKDGKSAAKAAASAIGARLLSEFNAIKDAGKDAADSAKKA